MQTQKNRRFVKPVTQCRHNRWRIWLLLALIPLAGMAVVASAADEGLDLMRQITSQWIKPNIMLVLDRSGSMNWPVHTSETGIRFAYTDTLGVVHKGRPRVGYDFTQSWDYGPFHTTDNRYFPNRGAGHGYWLRVDKIVDPTKLNIVDVGMLITAAVSSGDWERHRIYMSSTEIATLADGDVVRVFDNVGHPEVTGLYEIEYINYGSRYIQLRQFRPDGIRDFDRFYFPQANTGLKIYRVRLGPTNAAEMEPRDAAVDGLFDATYPDNFYVHGMYEWYPGDLIRVSGMADPTEDGIYIIKSSLSDSGANPGYRYFKVAKTDANGTWSFKDPDSTMTSGIDATLTMQRVMPASMALPGGAAWYFVAPSRMAIAKNVLGRHIWIYEQEDDQSFTATDGEHTPYWTFTAGTGPDAGTGAFYDWYLKAWVNWDESFATNEPVGDVNHTTAIEPSDLVDEFSDVINWGFIAYSGSSCSGQNVLVTLNPDDSSQGPVVDSMEYYLDLVPNGGLSPSGSTPTKDALATARNELLVGSTSVWDRDARSGCDRTYGTILMTDGVSNQCNPNNNSWGGCPTGYSDYPAGLSELMWDGTVSGTFLTHMRTWVIGISPAVGRCELNYTAYRGRTDASSPNNDAGFQTEEDPRLPEGSPGSYDDTSSYAYFTNSADELKDAFADIISSMGAGGYATGAPSVSATGSPSGGSIAFLGSTYYPTWEGHLRALDLAFESTSPEYDVWDAADMLSSQTNPNGGFARRIYTWDPSNSNAIMEIVSGNTAPLDAICGSCGMTNAVVNFIRGGDGIGNMRRLQLGPIVNSTPTLIGRPQRWDQNNAHEHSSFETTYGARHSLVWVGTSDGTIRAFDIVDGAEILCLVPPDLLDHQVQLYNKYASNPTEYPLGQDPLPSRHRYGVANSPRFLDVYFDDENTYKTVLLITEGPGGSGLHAIDVTHPYPGRTIDSYSYPADPNYGYGQSFVGDPFQVLWSKTADGEAGTDVLTGLGSTWSIPALAPVAETEWRMHMGAGYFDNTGNFIEPPVYSLDPVDGTPTPSNFSQSTPELTNASTYWVTNQSFADTVFWDNSSKEYQPDNLATEGVQGDLNGHLWRIVQNNNSIDAELLISIPDDASLGDPEPIYYSPAVAGFPGNAVEFSLYVFTTGSYFETSSDIVGSAVGTSGNFIPKIYLAARDLSDGTVDYHAIPTSSLPHPDGGTLGPRTMATAPPMIFTPSTYSPGLDPFALFLLYDPDATTCIGVSYIIKVSFNPYDFTEDPDVETYTAGTGTSGGFALTGETIVVAQSGVGEGQQAILVTVPDLVIPLGGGEENVRWWVELQ